MLKVKTLDIEINTLGIGPIKLIYDYKPNAGK